MKFDVCPDCGSDDIWFDEKSPDNSSCMECDWIDPDYGGPADDAHLDWAHGPLSPDQMQDLKRIKRG